MTVHLSQNMLARIHNVATDRPSRTVCGLSWPDSWPDSSGDHKTVAKAYYTSHGNIIAGLNANQTTNDAWKLVDCPLCILAMDSEESAK